MGTTFPPSPMENPSSDPMVAACRAGDIQKVQQLLQSGTRVNSADKGTGLFALGIAAYKGNFPLVKYLIENGADVNFQSFLGPAILASKTEEIALFLLEQGTDLSRYKGEKGSLIYKLLFFTAAGNGWNILLSEIHKKTANPDLLDNNNRTPLFAAASNGNIETLKMLISWGAKIDAIDKDGNTPLMIACWAGQIETIKELVNAGADVNHIGKAGFTAYALTICRCWNPTPPSDYGIKDKIPILKVLLQAGAKTDNEKTNKLKGTPCEKEYEFLMQEINKH